MRFKNLLYAASLILITVLACQKEVSVSNLPGTSNATTISATISGRVVNENGLPIQGAIVKAGTTTTQTNTNGEFNMNNATVVDKAAFVTVEKSGYFTGSRTFIAKANQKHFIEVELLPATNAGTVSAANGGTVTLSNTSAVTLPANAVVVKSTGAAYSGTVQVAMTWIDPTSNRLMRQMPGDLRGIDETSTEVGLQSFGMLGVELTGSAGEKLQIAVGKKATLNFPLPASIVSTAPATIALGSFNEATGLWKQEGTATKSGNSYTAEVSHFSFWNCDAPFPQVQFSATFTNQNGQPLQHAQVRIKRTTVNSFTSGFTDNAGLVSGIVPKNEPLILEVYTTSSCNTAIFTQNIGPFSTNTNMGTVAVTVSGANTYTVTGTVVNCSSAPVTAGYVNVNLGNFTTYRAPVVNGSFTLTFPSCAATSQQVTYYAVDSTSSQQSTPVTATLTVGSNALGAITACGTSTQRFVNFTIDGVAYNLTSPPDSTTARSQQGVTQVNGFKIGSGTSFTSINFGFNGTAIGSAPISFVFIQAPTLTDSTTVQTGAFNVTVTEYGAVGAYIAGSFTGNLNGSGSTLHPVTCSFRVRREQ
jgi:hypothetical protein